MNVAELTAEAWDLVPTEWKGPVTFTRTAGSPATTTAPAIGVPARPSRGDTFREAVTIREKTRELVVDARGLAFDPAEGMRATWEAGEWTVLGASPLRPPGSTATALWRVSIKR